ncbi:hypothetical protein PRK78_003369 [Emydomyces testavorans]|uniref:Uncharacterized protein n=1 Tax=Emydomyces testavorans TaxID=2070801 RepID=A0AAF0DG22_9EURO|nr:hypothetical protein PRK78_003369 [Emydomyces testavorans]
MASKFSIIARPSSSETSQVQSTADAPPKQEASFQLVSVIAGIVGTLMTAFTILALYIYLRRKRGRQHATKRISAESTSTTVAPSRQSYGLRSTSSLPSWNKLKNEKIVSLTRSPCVTIPPPVLALPLCGLDEPPIRFQPASFQRYHRKSEAYAVPASTALSRQVGQLREQDLFCTRNIQDITGNFTGPLSEENGTSGSSLCQSPVTKVALPNFPSPISPCGVSITTRTGSSRDSSIEMHRLSHFECMHRISRSIPSPSLEIPDEFRFGVPVSNTPCRVYENSCKRNRTRSCSSSVIVLPGRSANNSISSKAPLRATASIISRWRKVRDAEVEWAESDLFDLLQSISDLAVDDDVYGEGNIIKGWGGYKTPPV